MNQLLIEVEAWVVALALALGMFVSWLIACTWGRRRSKDPASPRERLHDASLAVLGLLLGFTFSMSLSRHEHRREMVVADSNAVGDFYTCASLLNTPEREPLQKVIRQYAEHRLRLASGRLDEATLQTRLTEIQQMHAEMQELVNKAIRNGTPIVVPLVNTLNNLTSNHAARLAALRDRLPVSIVILLFVSAILSMGLVGLDHGLQGERPSAMPLAFIALVCLIVWVILDLNQPNKGAISVSQEPMARVIAGMNP